MNWSHQHSHDLVGGVPGYPAGSAPPPAGYPAGAMPAPGYPAGAMLSPSAYPAGAVLYPSGAPAGQRSGEPGVLHPSQRLNVEQSIYSRSGAVYLKMQGDGNLVLYRSRDNYPLWSSHTEHKGGVVAVMQEDGNLVVYDGRNTPLWASNTHGRHGARLDVQDDGNLCIYQGSECKWATMTHGQI
ncbi:hypothetical protein BV898_17679 [Hypsibius exemplaris]|uniref:Bulb-type lectin domain-containing protein n=1 Tax=Hypsibius exemplaris TaxID=2072580 RepID=A0A9X6NP76_HYPEX|nr:hypothetical protein BV898_17679 [Hypsibius exemplaris]